MASAALGGTVDVPTLEGQVVLKIPAETQSGRVFGLRGKGIRSVRAAGVGDLFCRVQVETPVKLTEKQKELLRSFDESIEGDGLQAQPARALVVRRRQAVFRADGGLALLRVAVLGASGPDGPNADRLRPRESKDISLTGALTESADPAVGRDAGEVAGLGPIGVLLTDDRGQALHRRPGRHRFHAARGVEANVRAAPNRHGARGRHDGLEATSISSIEEAAASDAARLRP